MTPHRCLLLAALFVALLAGCGKETSTVDPAPFRQAIEAYLQSNNMALAIKDIKQGLEVTGPTAQLKASLVHEELGGPSVTWTFHFELRGDTWTAVRHDD